MADLPAQLRSLQTGLLRGRRRRRPPLLPPGRSPRVEPEGLGGSDTWPGASPSAIAPATSTREVTSSYNEARITPISNDRQLVLESAVEVTPPAVGLPVLGLLGHPGPRLRPPRPPHELVDHRDVGRGDRAPRPTRRRRLSTWGDLARPDVRDRFAELLAPTVYVPRSTTAWPRRPSDLRRRGDARGRLPGGRSGGCGTACATSRARPPCPRRRPTCCDRGSGVCQDFAHLALALLRATGIPARYVSGYLHPSATAELGQTARRREPRVGRGVDRRVAGRSTPPTAARWASATWSWAGRATTPTSRRSTASTTAVRPRTWAWPSS